MSLSVSIFLDPRPSQTGLFEQDDPRTEHRVLQKYRGCPPLDANHRSLGKIHQQENLSSAHR